MNKVMRKMNDVTGVVVDTDSINAFYSENLEHPRIYLYVHGAKIVLDYKDKKTFEDDLGMLEYYMLGDQL